MFTNIKITPVIVHKKECKRRGLYKSMVEYPDCAADDKRLLPSHFITKELKLLNSSSSLIKINPILCEAFINKNFKSPFLHVAEYVTIQDGIITLFFTEGESDFSRIKKANFDKIKFWVKTLMKAITYLHLHRMLHGDIKCSNILMVDGLLKLTDFGSSTLIIGNGCQNISTKLYTPTHRAPEIWFTNTVSLSADIWALGCTIFELIYGYSLFKIKDRDVDYMSQMNTWCQSDGLSNFDFPEEWNNPVYTHMNKIILKCLNPVPSERPTIFELAKYKFFESNMSTSPPDHLSLMDMLDDDISICNYSTLNECPIVANRIYTEDNAKKMANYRTVKKFLDENESDNEVKMLVLCMFECSEYEIKNPKNFIMVLLVIVYLLSNKNLHTLAITKNDISNILLYSNRINFQYINWTKFYAITENFHY